MQISDKTIRDAVSSGELGVTPGPTDIQYQPASLDLHLGREFFSFSNGHEPIDPDMPFDESWGEKIVLPDSTEFFLLEEGRFLLATTVETVRMPNDWVARVEGRSSLGRLGLIVHATAGFIDPGFTGQITLEMFNLGHRPIKLRPGMRICQLSFTKLDQPAVRPYGHPELKSKYNGQVGVTSSKLHLDVKEAP